MNAPHMLTPEMDDDLPLDHARVYADAAQLAAGIARGHAGGLSILRALVACGASRNVA